MKSSSPLSVPQPQPSEFLLREWGFLRPFLAGSGMTCLFMLSGCSIATLPVKATGKVVDWSTTSQDEADRNRGREMRKQDKAYENCIREGHRDC